MPRRLSVIAVLALVLSAAACTTMPGQNSIFSLEGQVLTVGPGKQYELPSDAALEARSGDTVRIFPGTYTDCAIWRQNDLIIEGVGGVVIGNRSCARRGVFVIRGRDTTVRNITLTGAQVPSHNGAGIRAEAANLTVENVRFIDNEDGILATARHGGTLLVRDSLFRGNGNCIGQCAHGIYVSQSGRLRIEHSEFVGQHSGHHIKSRADVTEILDNFVHDGPDGNASYLVDIPNGGTITIAGNRFEKGPHTENPTTAIAIGAEQSKPQHDTPQILVENNQFINDMAGPTVFVHNYAQTPAILNSNRMQGPVTPLVGPGTVSGPAS